MSEEEYKKGRVSELEGQQQASGRAMFLLSGPQREGGSEGGSVKGGKGGTEQPVFFLGLPGKSRGQSTSAIRPGLFTSTAFSEEAYSVEHWPPPPCHPRQEGKQQRRRRSMYALISEEA